LARSSCKDRKLFGKGQSCNRAVTGKRQKGAARGSAVTIGLDYLSPKLDVTQRHQNENDHDDVDNGHGRLPFVKGLCALLDQLID
jgi:hypothetical protein